MLNIILILLTLYLIFPMPVIRLMFIVSQDFVQ